MTTSVAHSSVCPETPTRSENGIRTRRFRRVTIIHPNERDGERNRGAAFEKQPTLLSPEAEHSVAVRVRRDARRIAWPELRELAIRTL